MDFYGSLKVSGRVTDSEGNPLDGATVALEGTCLEPPHNPDVHLCPFRLRPGNYVLVASTLAYETATINLVLQESQSINIILKESTLMFDVGCRKRHKGFRRMPIAQTTISKEQIDENNTGFDVPYLLELQPSVCCNLRKGELHWQQRLFAFEEPNVAQ